MDSMLPPAGNDAGWQEKARAMIQALVFFPGVQVPT
nr:hypothetical protein pPsy0462a_00040 [Pseudomonas syringae]